MSCNAFSLPGLIRHCFYTLMLTFCQLCPGADCKRFFTAALQRVPEQRKPAPCLRWSRHTGCRLSAPQPVPFERLARRQLPRNPRQLFSRQPPSRRRRTVSTATADVADAHNGTLPCEREVNRPEGSILMRDDACGLASVGNVFT